MSDDLPPTSAPEDIEKVLTGGVPMGRWKEGQLFDGISPTPGLLSAANWRFKEAFKAEQARREAAGDG